MVMQISYSIIFPRELRHGADPPVGPFFSRLMPPGVAQDVHRPDEDRHESTAERGEAG